MVMNRQQKFEAYSSSSYFFRFLIVVVLLLSVVNAQDYEPTDSYSTNITLVAGSNTGSFKVIDEGTTPMNPLDANFAGGIFALGVDAEDNVYFSTEMSNLVYKIDSATGLLRRYAGVFPDPRGDGTVDGSDTFIASGDGGPAIDAVFSGIEQIVVARNGDVYVLSGIDCRKITAATGIVSMYHASLETEGFYIPINVVIDEFNNLFYPYDDSPDNNQMRRLDSDGVTTSVVVNTLGTEGYVLDNGVWGCDANTVFQTSGIAGDTVFCNVRANLAFDHEGNLIELQNGQARMYAKTADGTITAQSALSLYFAESYFTFAAPDIFGNWYGWGESGIEGTNVQFGNALGQMLAGTFDSSDSFLPLAGSPLSAYIGDGGPAIDAMFYCTNNGNVAMINGGKDILLNDCINTVVRKISVNVCEANYYSSTGRAEINPDTDVFECTACPTGSSTQGEVGQTTCVCDYGWGETGVGYDLVCVESCVPLYYNPDNRKCEECDYPFISSEYDPEECYFVHLNFSSSGLLGVMLMLAVFYLAGLSMIREKNGSINLGAAWGLFLYTLMPALDFFTDLVYLLSTQVANIYVFVLLLFFTSVPTILFFKLLRERGIHFSPLAPDWFSLTCSTGMFSCLKSYSILLPLIIVNFLYKGPIILLGIFCYMTKLFAINAVQDNWVKAYSGLENPHKHPDPEEIVDTEVLNEALMDELMYETGGQIVVQGLNNFYSQQWDTETFISTSVSLLATFDGVYTFLYFEAKGIPLADIPVDVKVGTKELIDQIMGQLGLSVPIDDNMSALLDQADQDAGGNAKGLGDMNEREDDVQAEIDKLLGLETWEFKKVIEDHAADEEYIHKFVMCHHDLRKQLREGKKELAKMNEKFKGAFHKAEVLREMKILKSKEKKVHIEEAVPKSSGWFFW